MIRIRLCYMSVLLLFLAGVFSSLPGEDKPVTPVETITAESIRHHVYFLASDALEGRTGSKGYQVAAQYGESQFRAAGLKPIVVQGDHIGYLQPVPVVRRTSKAEPVLTVKTPKGETKYLHGKDFRWLDGEILGCENKPLQVPGVFFYSGNQPDRHKPTDDADKIDYEKAEKISRLGYEITKELATRTVF